MYKVCTNVLNWKCEYNKANSFFNLGGGFPDLLRRQSWSKWWFPWGDKADQVVTTSKVRMCYKLTFDVLKSVNNLKTANLNNSKCAK